MEFYKYNSIENSYQRKFMVGKTNRHPELLTCRYIVQQKYDGSNFQICIQPDEVRYGRRKDWIEDNGVSFNNHLEIMSRPAYASLLDNLKGLGYDEVRIYGEIFGEGICKRVDYGKGKFLLFFDMYIDGVKLTQEKFYEVMESIGAEDVIVENYGIYDTLNEALEVENYRYNKYGDPDSELSFTEGNVIKPYEIADHGMLIKHKNEWFTNLMGTKVKKVRIIEDVPDDVAEMINIFESFIDENRVIDMFSKMGEIDTPKDIGKYLKAIQTDAIEDYLKEHMEVHKLLDSKWQKKIFGSGPQCIIPILKKYL